MRRFALVTSIALILAAQGAGTPWGLLANVAAQTPSSKMQDMQKMHEQMMAEMKAGDARLDALVNEMNAAADNAKVNAVAAVVTELVRQGVEVAAVDCVKLPGKKADTNSAFMW